MISAAYYLMSKLFLKLDSYDLYVKCFDAGIYFFNRLSRPHLAAANFSLLTTFPNKELTDDSQNLKDAGLINAAILLRMK